jgi:uncharacterized protein
MAKNTTNLCVITHILGIFTSFIGPLIVYLASKDRTVKKHAAAALNWQIIAFVGYIIANIIGYLPVIGFMSGILSGIIFIVSLIFGIVAASHASKLKLWKYPISHEFFS